MFTEETFDESHILLQMKDNTKGQTRLQHLVKLQKLITGIS